MITNETIRIITEIIRDKIKTEMIKAIKNDEYGEVQSECLEGQFSLNAHCPPEDATWRRNLKKLYQIRLEIGIRNTIKVLGENLELGVQNTFKKEK
jgi:hypothetical protein